MTFTRVNLSLCLPKSRGDFKNIIIVIDRLSDEELEVRECAVKMISFLVLHEMVRVKGQIAEMALRCADGNARVAHMARQFFRQLANKGNALYNVVPDITSRLSDPELRVPEDQYRLVMRYVLS